MKKEIVFLAVMLLLVEAVFAEKSIFDYMNRVDENYKIVLGMNGKSGDSFAAAELAVAFKKINNADVEVVLESQVSARINKVLLGHPCDNALMHIDCESWSYKPGQAVILVKENNLIVAGGSMEDTMNAARLLRSFKAFKEFKQFDAILVEGAAITPLKKSYETVCGDGVCDDGEFSSCFVDCSKTTCFDLCITEGYTRATCRSEQGNPSSNSCEQDEVNNGKGYCAEGRVCCCLKVGERVQEKVQEQNVLTGMHSNENIEEVERSDSWITELFENPSLVVSFLLLLVIAVSFFFFWMRKES